MIVRLTVNGREHALEIAAGDRLIKVLREQLGLTGTKQGCGVGECGTCTVLVGGRPNLACMLLASRVKQEVRTVEGLGEQFMPLRKAFADEGGFQCGFCTPGQIMQAAFLLLDGPLDKLADETWLRGQMNGNVCRCTGYGGIVRALMSEDVRALARDLRKMPKAPLAKGDAGSTTEKS